MKKDRAQEVIVVSYLIQKLTAAIALLEVVTGGGA